MVSLESRPRRRSRVLNQQSSESMVLLDLDGGEYFALEGIGGRVWELCDGTRSLADVAATLAEEYDAPLQVIQDDVLGLVADLVDEKLLQNER